MSKIAVIGAAVAVLDIVSPVFIDALMRSNRPFNNDPELCRQTHNDLHALHLFTRRAARTLLFLSKTATDRDIHMMLEDIQHPNWNDATISEAVERVLASQCDRYLQDIGVLYACVVDIAAVLGINVRTVGLVSRLPDMEPWSLI